MSRSENRDSRQPVSFSVLPFEDIEKERWDSLFRRSATANLFYDHTLISAAMAAWPECRPDGVIAGQDRDGELVFLQPYRERTSSLGKTIEFLRIPSSDRLEPLTANENRESILGEFADFVIESLSPDLVIAKSLSEEFHAFLCKRFSTDSIRLDSSGSGVTISLPSTTEEFLSRYKSGFRNQIKRKIRKGANAGLTFRLVDSTKCLDEYDLGQALRNHTRLHEMRFKSISRDSFFVKPDFQKFHQSLCDKCQDPAFSLMFVEALHEGKIVGSMYGMRTPSIYIYLMIGFDPDFAPLSIGNLMIFHAIENLIAEHVEEFDFKVGNEAYKRRWAKSEYTKRNISIRFSLRGRMLSWPEQWRKVGYKVRGAPEKLGRMLASKPAAST